MRVQRVHGAKGERTRRALLDAALQVLGGEGRAALTHRRVAQEAGVSLGSTTYYFASLEQLLAETLRHAVAVDVDAAEALSARLAAAPPGSVVELVSEELARRVTGPDRLRTAALYELHLDAVRRPDLHDALAEWTRALLRMVAAAAPRSAAGLLAPAVTGLLL
ncbi:MAG: TetR family transcriptional regulator, partial [Actinomycetota bacterium]|nr:TetR family transcriptional regulator [Actinomycetota bacterium]